MFLFPRNGRQRNGPDGHCAGYLQVICSKPSFIAPDGASPLPAGAPDTVTRLPGRRRYPPAAPRAQGCIKNTGPPITAIRYFVSIPCRVDGRHSRLPCGRAPHPAPVTSFLRPYGGAPLPAAACAGGLSPLSLWSCARAASSRSCAGTQGAAPRFRILP